MRDGHGDVTLQCPRCAGPIACSLQEWAGGVRLVAVIRGCRCPLDEDEADWLARQLAALTRGRDVPD
jgi:hypothetical protein